MPEPSATHPQTRLAERLFKELIGVAEIEAKCGRFHSSNNKTYCDGNFLRLLRVLEKIITWLGEEDRYYRQWLGLAFIVSKKLRLKLTVDEFHKECGALFDDDLAFITPELFRFGKRDFISLAYAGHLPNLTNSHRMRAYMRHAHKNFVRKQKK